MTSDTKNMAQHAADAVTNKSDNVKYANASYSWQTFLIDFYRRIKQYYNFDFDSFMIMIVTVSHVTHENYKEDPGIEGSYKDFIKEFKDTAPGSLSKRKLGINAISNILEMPEETTRRKIEKLIKQGLLTKSKLDGIILSETFVEKHYPFANQTAKNLGKLIRTFDKAGLLSAAKDFKM